VVPSNGQSHEPHFGIQDGSAMVYVGPSVLSIAITYQNTQVMPAQGETQV